MSAADWIVQAQIPWKQLVYFGPPDFPAYARLRFIPDPTKPGQEEADANVAEDDPSDIKQTRRAFLHLRRITATPENCYFCVWEGYSGLNVPPSVLRGPMVTIPHRKYFSSTDRCTTSAAGMKPSVPWDPSRPPSPGRLTRAGASPTTSTHTGPESEPSKH